MTELATRRCQPLEGQPAMAAADIAAHLAQAPGWMEHVVTLYATPATLQRLGLPAGIDELQFRVADDTATPPIRRSSS